MRLPLNDVERRMLDLEHEDWSKSPGGKEQAIRDRLGLSAIRYYQLLNHLLGTEAALEYDPIVVKRLLRLRDRRHRARHPEVA
jgi:hypothetical protein